MLCWKRLIAAIMSVFFAALLLIQPLSPSLAASQSGTGKARIAFVTVDRDTRTVTLATSDSDGRNVIPFITNFDLFNPVWSPDGTQLAFSANKSKGSIRYFVYVINSDGSNLRQLSRQPSSEMPSFPVWSPDGRQLLYAIKLGGGGQYYSVFKVNADGTGEERIQLKGIKDGLYWTWLAWSPDGSQIAIHAASLEDWTYGQLTILDADGSNPRPFPAAPDGHSYSHLVWSPDGTKVILYRIPLGTGERQTLTVANADGSNPRVIVTSPPVNISSPSWSPDSSQIVFVANDAVFRAPGDLWVVNADGSNLHRLHIADEVGIYLGTSWRLIPANMTPPAAPIALAGVK